MGQIIFIVAAIAIIAIGRTLNKRMGQALEEETPPAVPQGYDPLPRQQMSDYEPELEELTPELVVPEIPDYKPSKYQFTYEQLENLTSEMEQPKTEIVPVRVAEKKSTQFPTRAFKTFALRDAVIYSEILQPKFKEYN